MVILNKLVVVTALVYVRSVRPRKLGELEISRTSKSFLRSVTAPIIIDVCCPMGSPYSRGIVRRD